MHEMGLTKLASSAEKIKIMNEKGLAVPGTWSTINELLKQVCQVFKKNNSKCDHFMTKENAGSFISVFHKISFYCIFNDSLKENFHVSQLFDVCLNF